MSTDKDPTDKENLAAAKPTEGENENLTEKELEGMAGGFIFPHHKLFRAGKEDTSESNTGN